MNARTHDAFAFASLVSVAAYFPPRSLNLYTFSAAIVGNIVGALIPDMDSAGNRLWDLLPAGNFLGRVFRRIFYKHRTLSHSLLGGWLLYKFLGFILPKIFNPAYVDYKIVFASVMIGYISHLFADMLTKDGLPLFFPLKFYVGIPPFESFRIRTGSWVENLVVLPGIGLYIVWFINNHREQLVAILQTIQS